MSEYIQRELYTNIGNLAHQLCLCVGLKQQHSQQYGNITMNKQQSYDHLIKLLIVGDSGIGKTNMLLRFCDNKFLTSHLTTIGIDFKTKTVDLDGKRVRMQVWDTAGQERFKTITQTYYRGAMGIFLVYAVNDASSFNSINGWVKQIRTHAAHDVVLMLIGNKNDSDREVSFEEGQKLADSLGVQFFQTSAKSNEGISDCFMAMAKEVKDQICRNTQIGVTSYTGSKLQRRSEDVEASKSKRCC